MRVQNAISLSLANWLRMNSAGPLPFLNVPILNVDMFGEGLINKKPGITLVFSCPKRALTVEFGHGFFQILV